MQPRTWIETVLAAPDPGGWLPRTGTAGRLIRSTSNWPALGRRLNLPLPWGTVGNWTR